MFCSILIYLFRVFLLSPYLFHSPCICLEFVVVVVVVIVVIVVIVIVVLVVVTCRITLLRPPFSISFAIFLPLLFSVWFFSCSSERWYI